MNQLGERALALACVSRDASVSMSLQEALCTLFPRATVELVDTNVERGLAETVDCAVIDAGGDGADGVEVLRGLRARGYEGAAVMVANTAQPGSDMEFIASNRFGARYCSLDGAVVSPLATAVTDAIRFQEGAAGSASAISLKALRQTQRLLAAGDLATRLQHSLNNPLAALLAEAQLLELEPLIPEHRASVERIIELSRRVIDVVRALDGTGRA